MANWFGGEVEGWNVSKDGEGFAYDSQEVEGLRVQVQEDGELKASYQNHIIGMGEMQDGLIRPNDGKDYYLEFISLEGFMDIMKDNLCTEYLRVLEIHKDIPISVNADNLQFDTNEDYIIEDSETEDVKVNFEVSGHINELAAKLPGISGEANFYVDVHEDGKVSVCATRVNAEMESTPEIYLNTDSAEAVKSKIEAEYGISLNEILEVNQPSGLQVDAQRLMFDHGYMMDVTQNGEIQVNFYVEGIINELKKQIPNIDDGANCYVNIYSGGDVSIQATRIDGYEQCSPEFYLNKQSSEDVREACSIYMQRYGGITLDEAIQEYDDKHAYKAVNIQWELYEAAPSNPDDEAQVFGTGDLPKEVRLPGDVIRAVGINPDVIKEHLEELFDEKVISYEMNDNLKEIVASAKEAANESITKTGEGSYEITSKQKEIEL